MGSLFRPRFAMFVPASIGSEMARRREGRRQRRQKRGRPGSLTRLPFFCPAPWTQTAVPPPRALMQTCSPGRSAKDDAAALAAICSRVDAGVPLPVVWATASRGGACPHTPRAGESLGLLAVRCSLEYPPATEHITLASCAKVLRATQPSLEMTRCASLGLDPLSPETPVAAALPSSACSQSTAPAENAKYALR
jgi:hypothetical protein